MNIRELDPAQQLGIREMQPRPSEAQVRRFLAEGLPILKGTVSRMFSDDEKAKSALEKIRNRLENPTRINITAGFVLGVGQLFLDNADKAYKVGDAAHFNFYHDLFYGVSYIGNGLVNVEDATKEASVIGEVLGQDIGTQAQNYLANLKRYGKLATFLQEDNSGFTLLDQLLADINSGTMFPFLTPEYVQEGAKIGAELYKRLYPLSE